MRAELDAAFFHLYGIERDDVDYIMGTFPIVKREGRAAVRFVPYQGTDPGDLRRDGRGHADRRAYRHSSTRHPAMGPAIEHARA